MISTALIALPLLALSACGGADEPTTSAPPPVTVPSVPSLPGDAVPSVPAGALGDAELCRTINSAKTTLMTTLAAGMDASGKVPPELSQRAMSTHATTRRAFQKSPFDKRGNNQRRVPSASRVANTCSSGRRSDSPAWHPSLVNRSCVPKSTY